MIKDYCLFVYYEQFFFGVYFFKQLVFPNFTQFTPSIYAHGVMAHMTHSLFTNE